MPAIIIQNQADGYTIKAATGSAYQFIRVIGGELTPRSDSVLTLKSGTDVIWTAASKAGVTIPLNIDPSRTIDCGVNKALVLGSSAGNVDGTLEIIVKGRPDTALAPLG